MEVSSNKENNINNEINIIYNVSKTDDKIKIFGKEFVKNNKNKCKIIFENKEYDLQEEFKLKNYEKEKIEIKLKIFKNVNNISYMFYECSSLSSLADISKWNISNVTDISHMLYQCSKLKYLPDISKLNTFNVNNMSYIFYECSSLSSLPDISKWNISNVNNMSDMFYNCFSFLNNLNFK